MVVLPSGLLLHQNYNLFIRKQRRRPCSSNTFICLVNVGLEDITQIVHNKVLIAASVSAAIGQLSKPFTSSLLYGKHFDLKVTLQAGGFPSTHSSAVVATATSLALERGFSDSIFGLTVVYASLVMYDAQGVRREVGNHAKALNKVLPKTQINSLVSKDRNDLIDSQEGTSSTLNMESLGRFLSKEEISSTSKSTNASPLLKPDKKMRPTSEMVGSSGLAPDVEQGSEKATISIAPLKESVGHTEVEVIAGALLGFFVSLAVNTIL